MLPGQVIRIEYRRFHRIAKSVGGLGEMHASRL